LSDDAIQAQLKWQIQNGKVPAPTYDAAGNPNTYYAVFFPAGYTIALGFSTSCADGGFVAYHNTIANTPGLGEIYYGVHPDVHTGGCLVGAGPGTPTQNEMSAASHELVETVTDPEAGLATDFAPPLAWYDPQGSDGEIGDICNQTEGTIMGADGFRYTVQAQWSNVANACIVSRTVNDDFSLNVGSPAANLTVGTSTQVSLSTATTKGGAQNLMLTATGLPSGVTATFNPANIASGQSSTITLTSNVKTPIVGTFSVDVTAVGTENIHAASFTLTVTGLNGLTIPTLQLTAHAGQPNTITLAASGGTAPYRWAHGQLPRGLHLNGRTGVLSGTPTQTGTFDFFVKVADRSKPKRAKIMAVVFITIS
jgi:hypothetical protein